MVRVMGMPANFRLLLPRMEFRERPQGWGQTAAWGRGSPGQTQPGCGGTGHLLPPSTAEMGTSSSPPLLLSSAGRSAPQVAQPRHGQLGWDPAISSMPRWPKTFPNPSSSPARPHLPPPHGSFGTGYGLAHQPDGLPAGSTARRQCPPSTCPPHSPVTPQPQDRGHGDQRKGQGDKREALGAASAGGSSRRGKRAGVNA